MTLKTLFGADGSRTVAPQPTAAEIYRNAREHRLLIHYGATERDEKGGLIPKAEIPHAAQPEIGDDVSVPQLIFLFAGVPCVHFTGKVVDVGPCPTTDSHGKTRAWWQNVTASLKQNRRRRYIRANCANGPEMVITPDFKLNGWRPLLAGIDTSLNDYLDFAKKLKGVYPKPGTPDAAEEQRLLLGLNEAERDLILFTQAAWPNHYEGP